MSYSDRNDAEQAKRLEVFEKETIPHNSLGFFTSHCTKTRMIIISIAGLVVFVACFAPSMYFLMGDDTATSGGPIRMAAFNVKHFGKSLMENEDVVPNLVKIFSRYDVVLVQEVRDSSHTALKALKTRLSAATGETWTFVSSAPLGRSKYYREQYVFFYKPQSVRLLGSHQVDDAVRDVYEREPFAVELEFTSISHKSKQRVILLALHAKPASAFEELQELPRTIRDIAAIYPKSAGVIAMGDLNADCSYLSAKARKQLEIFNSKDMTSVISDKADTAVSRLADCAYDRVVVYGAQLDVREGGVYNFESDLQLDEETAADVSDHFPVEFSLY